MTQRCFLKGWGCLVDVLSPPAWAVMNRILKVLIWWHRALTASSPPFHGDNKIRQFKRVN